MTIELLIGGSVLIVFAYLVVSLCATAERIEDVQEAQIKKYGEAIRKNFQMLEFSGDLLAKLDEKDREIERLKQKTSDDEHIAMIRRKYMELHLRDIDMTGNSPDDVWPRSKDNAA